MLKHAKQVMESFGYLSLRELESMEKYTLQLPDNPIIINIGAGAGTSGLIFLETREDAIVYTIDIQDESSPFGCLEGERQVVNAAGLGHRWQKTWFQIHEDSKKVGRWWPTHVDPTHRNINLLFIDGSHSYTGCSGDIYAWMPHLISGGIVLVHDYKKEEFWKSQNPKIDVTEEIRYKIIKPWPGVDLAVDEILVPNVLHLGTYDTLFAGEKRKELDG